MRRALLEDFSAVPGFRVVLTVDPRFPEGPGPWSVVRVGPDQELPTLERLSAEADWTLIIAPESDGILIDRARRVDRVGGRSLGSSPTAIALAGNALMTVDCLNRAGIRTPPTWAVSPRVGWPRRPSFPLSDLATVCPFVEVPEPMTEQPPDRIAEVEIEHPAVLKPVDGAGAIKTFVLAGETDWPDPSWRPEVAVLQPWIDGRAMSTAALVSGGGRAFLLGCASQRIAVQSGRIRYLGGEAPVHVGPTVSRMVDRVVGAIPGLKGWVGIDWIDDGSDDPIVLEVNPRPTTSIVGYRSSLPPGLLARSWLGLVDDPSSSPPEHLFQILQASCSLPFRFDADGSPDPASPGGKGA